MTGDLVLRRGLVMTAGGPVVLDVVVRDGVVVEVGPDLDTVGCEVIDCSGAWVGPGFVDLHTHLREPGHEWKEDIESGSQAAAAGGYTAVVAMPNTAPPLDAGHLARHVTDRGREVGLVDVFPAGCVSAGLVGERLARLDELSMAGVHLFTDDGDVVADTGILRAAMDYLADLGAVVARDIALVRLTGCRYHVQHVSAAQTVALVAAAKAEGLPVTAEVTPHHLAFDHHAVTGTDPAFKMMPPLRSPEDRAALVAGLRDGTIDALATDHAPHADHEKDVPFEEAPSGVIGLEWAAAVTNTVVGLDPVDLFDRMSVAPARIAEAEGHGLWVAPGVPANLTVFDAAAPCVVHSRSRSANTPYREGAYAGSVRLTLLRGKITSSPTMAGRP